MAIRKNQEEFAAWLLMTKRDRRTHGLPATEVEWADWKGITARTLRRWKSLDEFDDYLKLRRAEMARQHIPNSTITAADVGGARNPSDARLKRRAEAGIPEPATQHDDPTYDPSLSPDELAYAQARDTLIQMAKDGSTEALNLYYRHYGQKHIEAERAASGDLAHLSDEQLAAEVVALLGEDAVASALADRAVDTAELVGA